jgi:hypothetical protein
MWLLEPSSKDIHPITVRGFQPILNFYQPNGNKFQNWNDCLLLLRDKVIKRSGGNGLAVDCNLAT